MKTYSTQQGIMLSALAAIATAAGCQGPSSDPVPAPVASGTGVPSRSEQSCDDSFKRVIQPIRIDDRKHGYFDSADLQFLLNPAIEIDSVELQASMKEGNAWLHRLASDKDDKDDKGDRRSDSDQVAPSIPVSLALNGLAGSSDGSTPAYRLNGHSDADETADYSFFLHQMRLNGGLPIQFVLGQILLNHGQVRISLQGNDFETLTMQIIVQGRDPSLCKATPSPTPSPSASPSINPSPRPTPAPQPSLSPTPTPVAPTTSIISVTPAGSPVSSSTVSFALGSNQVGVSYQCSLDGAAFSSCSSNVSYSGLASSAHSFTAQATNSQGLTDAKGASYSWTVDTVPPSVTITNLSQLSSPTQSRSISVAFAAVDTTSTTFTCSLDGAQATTCVSPVSYSGLTEGAHQFAVAALDAAGNSSLAPATYKWQVDVTPPTVNFTQVSPASSITNQQSAQFSFGASETSTFECSLDSAGFQSCTSPMSIASVAEGAHSFQVRATDLAGNVGLPATYTWTVDITPPVISTGAIVPASGLTNARNISVEFTANEAVSFQCSLDGAAATACSSPFSSAIVTEGNHEVTVTATDAAGNMSAPVTISWIMDYTLPQIAFGAMTPSAASYINSTSFQAEVTSSETTTLACTLNGNSISQTASPVALNGLAEGAYNLGVTGTDQAGNVGASISHSFTVDITPPVLTASATYASGALTTDTVNSFTFSANESSTFACNLDGAGFSSCSSPLAVSGLADGSHLMQIEAIDLAGNVSAPSQLTWSVDTTPPTTTLSEARTSDLDITFSFTANEPVTRFECSLDSQGFQACSSPLSLSGLSAGNHTFMVRGIDLAGNIESSAPSYGWSVDPPVTTTLVSATPAASLTNSTSMAFQFSSNWATATFVCSWDGAPASACAPGAAKTGLADGSHTFLVHAIDSYGTQDPTGAAYTWTVDTAPPVTTLTQSRTTNQAITFSFTASEAVNRFECSQDGAAYQSCSSPLTLSGLSVGNHTFSVRGVDLAGNVEPSPPSYSWSVDPAVTTSLVSASPAANPTNSTGITFQFSSNVASATFVCSWDGSAASACSSGASRSGLAEGTHTFSVHAIDSWGTQDSTGASYSWTVDTTPPVVVTFAPAGGSYSVTVNWTTNEPASSKVNWGMGTDTSRLVAEDSGFVTSHSVKVSGLSASTTYSFIVGGHDRAGNAYTSIKKTARTF